MLHAVNNPLSNVFTETEIRSESAEGVNTMEYMVENLMKKIDENKDRHSCSEISVTMETPIVTSSSNLKPVSSQTWTNSYSSPQSGDNRYQNSLAENIEKLKKVHNQLLKLG